MNQLNYNTNYDVRNTHLTIKDREIIEYEWNLNEKYLNSGKLKQSEFKRFLAYALRVAVRTIEREFKRGIVTVLNSDLTTRNVYSAAAAQNDYNNKSVNKGPEYKIGKDIELSDYLVSLMVEQKYSPGAALAQAKSEGYDVNISERTLYDYVNSGLLESNVKKIRNRNKGHKKGKIRAPKGKSIEDRDESILSREEFGHREMDTVVGTRKKGKVLLVLTERKTTLEYIELIDGKSTRDVKRGLKRLIKRIGKKRRNAIKTITVDNGTEFKDFDSIESIVDCMLYYCHPYCSGERGTNENQNKLIRRFLPKGISMDKVTKKLSSILKNG